ncbi:MAG: hypothetical protein PVG66_02440 [Chromatiales bacterium]|jgi:hypothetical protein
MIPINSSTKTAIKDTRRPDTRKKSVSARGPIQNWLELLLGSMMREIIDAFSRLQE